MRPIVGISAAWSVETWGDSPENGGYFYAAYPYIQAVVKSGGIAVMVPPAAPSSDPDCVADQVIKSVHAFLLTGGGNGRGTKPFKPALQEQQPIRYDFEARLIKTAFDEGIPVLGICRGCQMMGEVLGGAIRRETVTGHKQHFDGARPMHEITIDTGSRLYGFCGVERWDVNSFHVQVIETPPPGFRVAARSDDGLVEAIEAIDKPFFIGTQFHPEELIEVDVAAQKLFAGFIESARQVLSRWTAG